HQTAFPIAQPMTTAVRAPKTFRRLAASETLNVRRFTAYGCRMVKSGPFRYDENQCGEPRRRLRRITALRNGSEPFPCPGEVEKRLDILLLEHGVSASIARFDS
ncbi:hypothetical protein, partial [Sphingopyxis panaciterrulae]|uniref:hypothetical protein n=1 Tax=Sphingopyxis panaciterrulae TaxID=462372 RepID=UPI001C855E05